MKNKRKTSVLLFHCKRNVTGSLLFYFPPSSFLCLQFSATDTNKDSIHPWLLIKAPQWVGKIFACGSLIVTVSFVLKTVIKNQLRLFLPESRVVCFLFFMTLTQRSLSLPFC